MKNKITYNEMIEKKKNIMKLINELENPLKELNDLLNEYYNIMRWEGISDINDDGDEDSDAKYDELYSNIINTYEDCEVSQHKVFPILDFIQKIKESELGDIKKEE